MCFEIPSDSVLPMDTNSPVEASKCVFSPCSLHVCYPALYCMRDLVCVRMLHLCLTGKDYGKYCAAWEDGKVTTGTLTVPNVCMRMLFDVYHRGSSEAWDCDTQSPLKHCTNLMYVDRCHCKLIGRSTHRRSR